MATALLIACAACGSGGSGAAVTTTTNAAVKPSRVYPGPAALVAGAQPQPNGFMWLLAKNKSAANLQQLNLTTGHIALVVPAPSSSAALAQSPSGIVGVGLATLSSGALEFLNGASGALVATVPLGAPVKAVDAGSDGTTFYVLNGTTSSMSVSLVNSQTDTVSVTVPVPLDTIAIAVDPQGQNLYALRSDGRVDQITVGTGAVTGSFAVGSNPVQLTTSDTGGTLYVLKTSQGGASGNVSVINLSTESQTKALPAPAHSVDLQLSPDGTSLYLVVGTPSLGNVQQFALPS
jgi:DNA-binding beta-propeller fold protein YncE